MIIWINGAFGAGKTTTANELNKRIPNSYVYDPENVGYFIHQNVPKSLHKSDFQDFEIWRTINVSVIEEIANNFDGVLIVPMTLVNPKYFEEIIGVLNDKGYEIFHYILYASRDTLLGRLKQRGEDSDSWPALQIERCIEGFSHPCFSDIIVTDEMNTAQVVDRILSEVNLSYDINELI